MSKAKRAPADATVVDAVDLWRVRLRLRHAHRAAHGTEEVREVILVEVRLRDGTVGWGECSALSHPTYSSEYTGGAWVVLRDELAPAVLAGTEPHLVGHPMATAAVMTAITDALLRRVDRSLPIELAEAHGGNPVASMPLCAVVGRRDTVDEVVAAVEARVDERVAMVKLKVTPLAKDLDAVGAVRATWPDLELAVDFNGTADADAVRRLDRLALAYIEQPAPADALVQSAHFAASTSTAIALDESVTSAGSFDAAVALTAGSIVNVKPARCGGPHLAADLITRARNAGFDVFVGGMIESGIGRAAALAVAALPSCTLPTDLGPSHAYFDQDLTEPLRTNRAGRIETPTGAGIGRIPVPAQLQHVVVDRVSLSR